jgi:hypothetical protein
MRRSVPTMSHTTHTQRNARTYSCHQGSTKARWNAHSVIAGIPAVHQRAAACYTQTQRNAHTYSCHKGSTKARRNAHSVIAGIPAVHQRAAAWRLVTHHAILMKRWVHTMRHTTQTRIHVTKTVLRHAGTRKVCSRARTLPDTHNTHAGAITRASGLTQT